MSVEKRKVNPETMKKFAIEANYFIPPEHLKWIRKHKFFEPGFGGELYGDVYLEIAGRMFGLDNFILSYMFGFVHAISLLDNRRTWQISNDDNPGELTFQRMGEDVDIFANDYFTDRTPAGNLVYESAAVMIPYTEFREKVMKVLKDFAKFLEKELPSDSLTKEFLQQFDAIKGND